MQKTTKKPNRGRIFEQGLDFLSLNFTIIIKLNWLVYVNFELLFKLIR